MSITYEYKIANLEYTNDDSKGVVVAHWRVDANDGDESVGAYGTLNFVPKPDDPNYITFDQLTEELVLGWVKAELDSVPVESELAPIESELTQIKSALAQKLNERLNPTVVSGNLPWEGSTDEIDPELAPE